MTKVLLDYPHQMGGHCGSGALRDLLHWAELGWGGPPTEGLVFALSGALDFAYLRSPSLRPPIYLVGRGGTLELDLPRRLDAPVELRSTDDAATGWDWIRSELDAGRPALAWADIAELPYLRVRLRMSRHDIVIIGYDDAAEIVYVVDNDRADIQEVPYAALARARSSTSFPEPTRHSTYFINWPDTLPDLSSVAADAFAQAAATLADSDRQAIASPDTDAITGVGVGGVEVFADDLAVWPAVFPAAQLDQILLGLAAFIEKAGTGGGLFRRLLSDGCATIATQTADDATRQLAHDARHSADAWTATATRAADTTTDPQRRAADCAQLAATLVALESKLVESLLKAHQSLDPAIRAPHS